MAELTFDCPHCQQPITCDEQWCGHQIQCPACQGALTVPPKPAPARNPLVPKPPAGGGKLSVGQVQQPAQAHRAIPIRNLAPARAKKKSPLVAYGVPALIIAGLGVGGYFGYGYYQDWQNKRAEAKKAAEAAAVAQSNATQQAAAAAAPPPVVAPVWTLDLDAAKIPHSRANGMLSGTNFLPEIARVDMLGGAQLLRLVQGQLLSPDRALLIYLHLKAGEKLSGQSFNISKEMKAGIPPISVLWRPTAGGQPLVKSFSSGYAMKLDFGETTNGVIPGTIFLALPDPDQSVIAGEFQATNGLAAPQPVAPAAPAAAPAMAPAEKKRAKKQ